MVSLLEILGALFLFAGCSLTLIAAIGIFRQGNLLDRQHIATKPQVLSLILNLTGAALLVRDSTMTWCSSLLFSSSPRRSPRICLRVPVTVPGRLDWRILWWMSCAKTCTFTR